MGVHISDMGLNVLFDLLNYTAEVDNAALQAADGKSIRKSKPMSIADMTKAGKVKA